MKKFLFITTLTPTQFLSPLRSALFEIYLKALNNQSYSHWEALLIGETEKHHEKIKYIRTDAITKSEKLKIAYDYIINMPVKPDYIIRMDDDDLISPFALEQVVQTEFDSYSDLYHSFYDITSGKISQQKRTWFPNTIIHKYHHAVAEFGEEGLPLFMHDHSKSWHIYYSGKKNLFAHKKHPLYLRIISPTNQSLKGMNGIISYEQYIAKYGFWHYEKFDEYEQYVIELINEAEKNLHNKINRKLSFNNYLQQYITYSIYRYQRKFQFFS